MIDTNALSVNPSLEPRFTPLVESSTSDLLTPPQAEKLLRFIAGDLATGQVLLLPALDVMEVLITKTNAILPVPQLPEYVLGIYQWRGKALWTVDLGQLLGFPALSWQPSPTDRSTSHNHGIGNGSGGHFILVLQQSGAALGLAVSQVEDIVSYDLTTLQPSEPHLLPEHRSQNLAAFTKGIFPQPNQGQHILLNSDYLLHPEIYTRGLT